MTRAEWVEAIGVALLLAEEQRKRLAETVGAWTESYAKGKPAVDFDALIEGLQELEEIYRQIRFLAVESRDGQVNDQPVRAVMTRVFERAIKMGVVGAGVPE